MRLPILQGIYADAVSDMLESPPINREPVIMDGDNGMSEGYLRRAYGITAVGQGPGPDRGAIDWDGSCYRVMGTSLVRVAPNGTVTVLGDVGGTGQCSLDYSFTDLIVASAGRLFYWNATAGLRQVTDPDLGVSIDAIWIDGYTMSTDGEFLVVTELNDPMAVDPLKYGSSEEDPDPVLGLIKVRGEVYALNRNTIEVFSNVGGSVFPFARNSGAQIPYGAAGTHAKAMIAETFAFVGGARNQGLGVYLAGSGTASKISTRAIDRMLDRLTADQRREIICESICLDDEQRLLVHLPDRTLVYYNNASQKAGIRVWAIYASGPRADKPYRGRNGVLTEGMWMVADQDGNIGYIDHNLASHFGEITGWRFDTICLFNENGRGIVQSVTLSGMPGRAAGDIGPYSDSILRETGDAIRTVDDDVTAYRVVRAGLLGARGVEPVAFMSYTLDGVTFGQEYAISTGRKGQRNKIMQWRKPRRFDSWMGIRFRGSDDGMAAFARLDVVVEPLSQ